jgi:molybdopterin molybdotransferase
VTEAPPAPHALQTVATAQQQLLDRIVALGSESVTLDESRGRILAEAVAARWDLPRFDNSAMDGYAVRAADIAAATASTPVALPVTGEAHAGAAEPPVLPARAAIRIMTGAPLPPGADAIVKQEDTERSGDVVRILVAEPRGTHVRRRGEDVRAGDVVLSPGGDITSVDVGVAAALGHDRVLVGRRPVVGVFASGDELVAAGDEPRGGQVVDSNTPMLLAAVAEAGGVARSLGVARDTPDAVRALVASAAGCDVIVSSAGVSVGERDHVREVVEELGSVDTWRVAMRPGKPMLIGRVGSALFFGLPGNPVSSAVTFELFVRSAIRKLQGATVPHRRRIPVRLGESMRKPAGLETYVRAVVRRVSDDVSAATSAGDQGSAMLGSLSAADCLLVLPADGDAFAAGTVVDAIPLR